MLRAISLLGNVVLASARVSAEPSPQVSDVSTRTGEANAEGLGYVARRDSLRVKREEGEQFSEVGPTLDDLFVSFAVCGNAHRTEKRKAGQG